MLWDWSNARWIVCGREATRPRRALPGTTLRSCAVGALGYDFPLIIVAIDLRTTGGGEGTLFGYDGDPDRRRKVFSFGYRCAAGTLTDGRSLRRGHR